MDDDLWPPIDESILKRLEETYPELCPEENWTDRQIWIYVGQRNVVRMLRSIYLEQNEV
jgi:Ni,Fe-hydrogenase III component G